jgi:hypothetical protein
MITTNLESRIFIDQLRPLDGLFGFDSLHGHYDGVSFFLALRLALFIS